MDAVYYTVKEIQGEYAYLKQDGNEELLFIAMALLPQDVDVGTRLKYELFTYTIIE
ncbi:MAG: hypothetical protein J6B34_06390 [Clostridia bacterium]|nr:hypothetical protein [Clostridia bacterium]